MDESETEAFKQKSSSIPSFSIQHPKIPPRSSAPKKSRNWVIPCILALPIFIALFIFIRSRYSDDTEPLEEAVSIEPTILFQQSKMQAPPMKNTPRLDHRNRVLCQILNNTNCQSNFIADSIDLFWVIAPLYNFDEAIDWYYYEKHEGFKSYIKSIGLPFITIEAIRFPETKPMWSREPTKYYATVPGNEPYDMQVYYYNMSYIRENLLNVAIRKLEKQAPWGYAVWIDAHQVFENPYWWEESIHKTEKYGSVQLFDSISYLSAENVSYIDLFSILRISLFVNHINVRKTAYGNAYAIAKDTYNKIGYIYDECIATHCDCAYTLASFPDGVGFNIPFPNYYKNFDTWIANTKKVFQGKRAYVRGHLQHIFHAGAFPYGDLAVACEKYGFSAARDITRDANFSLMISNKELTGSMDWIIYDAKRRRAETIG